MKILITGSSGFLGSWACRVLSQSHEVVGLSRDDSKMFRLKNISRFKSIQAPTHDWSKIIIEQKPDAIVFLHWNGVENNFRNSILQDSNIEFFKQLCEAAVSVKVGKIIGIGSQAELGPNNKPISDSQQDNPTTKYGLAKVKCREIGFEVCRNSSSEFIWGRVISTYGPLDSTSWMIPSAIISLNKSEKFQSTLGEQQWSFLHAFDFTRALAKLIETDSSHKIFNIGNTSTVKLNYVLRKIENLLGKTDLVQFGALPYRSDQVMLLEPKCEGLLDLGWTPSVSLEEGLVQTINWFTNKAEQPLKTISNDLEFFNFPSMT